MKEPELLRQSVTDAVGLVGVFLALSTLLTLELSRKLNQERTRTGGARQRSLRAVTVGGSGLALVTGASLVTLLPIASDIVENFGGPEWQPVFPLFLLTLLLLISLVGWQVSLIVSSLKKS